MKTHLFEKLRRLAARVNTLLVLASLALALGACSLTLIEGTGIEAIQARSVAPFQQVRVNGPMEVMVEGSTTERVTISADDNLVDRISTQTVDGVLTVELIRREDEVLNNTLPLFALIQSPELVEVRADAASSVEVQNLPSPSAGVLSLLANGASTLKATGIDTGELIVAVEGASTLSGQGRAETVTLLASGGSVVDLSEVGAVDVGVQVSGGSVVDVQASGTLTITASGASTVSHSGNPEKVEVVEQSGGSVIVETPGDASGT
jgi:hypothetical protein